MKPTLQLLSLTVTALLIGGCTTSAPTSSVAGAALPSNERPTTVLVYMTGSDLEGTTPRANNNISQVLKAKFPEQANFVFCTGGSNEANSGLPVKSWKTVKRHILKMNRLEELSDLGSVSMDDPNTLKEFILWGEANYPAQRYILLMWDHGGGYAGFGGDRVTAGMDLFQNNSIMPQAKLVSAIGDAYAQTKNRFDLIGFDACLMACDEIAAPLAPYANYLLASERIESGEGWDWTPLTSALSDNAAIDATTLAKIVADSYLAQFKEADAGPDATATLSLVDLSKEGQLQTALSRLSQLLQADLEGNRRDAIISLVTSRYQCQDFGFGVTDLIQWMENLKKQNLHPQEVQAVIDAANQAIVYNVRGPLAENSNGLAIYYPHSLLVPDSPFERLYPQVQYNGPYQSMVQSTISWSRSQSSGITLSNFSIDPIQNSFQALVTSALGLQDVDVVLSTKAPGPGTTPVIQRFQATADVYKDFAPLQISVPLPTTQWTWDGRPIAPERNGFGGKLVSYSLRCYVNDEECTATIVEDSSGPVPVYRLTEYYGIEVFDRGEDFKDSDKVELLVETFDPSSGFFRQVRTGQPFLAGSRQIANGPLPSGTYYLYVTAKDLRGGIQLSSNATTYVVP